MMEVTLNIPDELAMRLDSLYDKLPQILELGLRELNASSQNGFSGAAQVFEFLAQLPTPEEILALHPSEELRTKIDTLLEKNRNNPSCELSNSECKTPGKSYWRPQKIGWLV